VALVLRAALPLSFLFHHRDKTKTTMQGEKFTSVKSVGIAQDRNARFRRTMEVRCANNLFVCNHHVFK
jgi:hypothetical protein